MTTDHGTLATITLLMLQRGCPDDLLDEAWDALAGQEINRSPGGMVRQIDAAIVRARD